MFKIKLENHKNNNQSKEFTSAIENLKSTVAIIDSKLNPSRPPKQLFKRKIIPNPVSIPPKAKFTPAKPSLPHPQIQKQQEFNEKVFAKTFVEHLKQSNQAQLQKLIEQFKQVYEKNHPGYKLRSVQKCGLGFNITFANSNQFTAKTYLKTWEQIESEIAKVHKDQFYLLRVNFEKITGKKFNQ